MASAGLRGKDRKKYKGTTTSDHAQPLADDLVQRRFKVREPNTVWAADISFLPTREGWLDLSVILDLPLAALQMAFAGRSPPLGTRVACTWICFGRLA